MKIAVIGLGKMGSAIVYRLVNASHDIIGFDINKESVEQIKKLGAKGTLNLLDVASQADIIWIMVPAGKPVDDVIDQLLPQLKKGTIIIDGGNSHYTDSISRQQKLEKSGITFLDCGVSGGLQGKQLGFCLMVGGSKQAYEKIIPIFHAIAQKDGFAYVGESGSGHYVKMVHNGIEYSLLEAYAEGFHLLKQGKYKDLNLEQISELWNHGAIIRSWILDLAHNIFLQDQDFKNISGVIGGGQTGGWTIEEAKKENVPVPLIEQSLEIRKWSQKTGGNYATKLVALLRNQFGGHEFKKI